MCVYRAIEVGILLALFSIAPIERAYSILFLLSSAYFCLAVFLAFPINEQLVPFGLIGKWEALAIFIILILEAQYFNAIALLFSGALLLTAGLQFRKFQSAKLTPG